MIDVEDLIALVRNYNPRSNADLIRKAYAYGFRMHDGQMRKSGEPYFTHPVAVAAILTEQRLDDATIITALLHDTIEDTRSTYSEISGLFGAEVAELVYAHDLKSCLARDVGSTPTPGTGHNSLKI